MKKYLLTFTSVLAMSSAFAQTDETSKDTLNTSSKYNKWSIELNVGQNKADKPFDAGYFSADPGKYFAFSDVNHYDAGVRYMFNPKFGLKLDFAYDYVKNEDGATNQSGVTSLPFETRQHRVGLQGIANLGRIMNFETFTSRFGILGHAGVQVSRLQSRMGEFEGVHEDNGGIIVGLTPQFRITNRIVLTGDFTYLHNVRQHFNWNGTYSDESNNLGGSMINTSLGLTFYLGGADVHADWYVEESLADKVADLDKRLAGVETGLMDSDDDGVADMFDAEPNTAAGAMVDTKGRTTDKNNNGIADNIENFYNNTNPAGSGGDFDIKRLINEKYVTVYFDFDARTKHTDASIDAVNFMLRYLKANPTANADIIGYADELGSSDYNMTLSRDRANLVKQVLVDAGISASRLTTVASGEDDSVDKSSQSARALVRRVSFEIK